MTTTDPSANHPRRTATLLGHEAAEATILQLWRSNRLPHAFLLCGPRGIGKATLAHRIARFVLANGTPGSQEPSLFGDIALPPDSLHIGADHPVFARVTSGGHADLLTIERSVNPDTGRQRRDIVVDDIRKVTGLIRHTAAEGGWRVVIVDSADDMNQNAANALLKVLEEPPPNVLFLLVNHASGGLLPTIRSRCRRLTLSPLSGNLFHRLLTDLRPAVDSAEDRAVIAYLTDGSIGDALQLIDAGGLALYRECVDLLQGLGRRDIGRIQALAERVGRSGRDEEFETLARLLDRVLALAIRHGATSGSGNTAPDEIVRLATRLLAAASLDRWVAVWDNVTRLMRQATSASLDRRQVVVTAFLTLDAVAGGGGR